MTHLYPPSHDPSLPPSSSDETEVETEVAEPVMVDYASSEDGRIHPLIQVFIHVWIYGYNASLLHFFTDSNSTFANSFVLRLILGATRSWGFQLRMRKKEAKPRRLLLLLLLIRRRRRRHRRQQRATRSC